MDEHDREELLRKLVEAGRKLEELDRQIAEEGARSNGYTLGPIHIMQVPEGMDPYDALQKMMNHPVVTSRARLMPPPKDEPLPGFNREDKKAAKAWGIKL